jgi:hypothetical protein
MLIAALLATAALAGSGQSSPAHDRQYPVAPTTLTFAHKRMAVAQGGQRVHVTIPVTPGVNAFGGTLAYQWDTGVDGGRRCQPGALPDLGAVTAGTVIDAPLPMPAHGWCRGFYSVRLEAVIRINCDNDPPPYCRAAEPFDYAVARAEFQAGRLPTVICHHRGKVERCWTGPSYRDPEASWSVSAPLDDLLGPDGATSEADPYFYRAFHGHPVMQQHWETEDNEFYGFPATRAEAKRMSRIVDRVLRAGRYHQTERSRSGRSVAQQVTL